MESRRRQSPPPSKAARFSVAELGLGLGPGSRRSSGFTFMQLQELEQQALIFHHIAAGLPVPLHLVLPIWKSVAASSPFASHRSFPSFMGCSDFDCGGTDAEPGRCRRTDGKKWRCSKPVILNQKYCERHVHRGRHRARKLAGDAAGETSLAAESTAHFSGGGRISSSTMHGFSPISVLPDGAEDGSS